MLNHNFYTGKPGKGGSSRGGGGGKTRVGRVAKVITSLSDPDCENPLMINGVFYRDIKLPGDESIANTLNFAYANLTGFSKIPLPGEIVTLIKAPSAESLTKPGTQRTYWNSIVNIWNHPHHSALPDTKQQDWEANLLGGQEGSSTINALACNPGDSVLEGRLGQTIRLGGYGTNPAAQSSGVSPYILISNGQIETDNGIDLLYEDIDKDANSLYFVSDHIVNLTPANTKRRSYDAPPVEPNKYVGNQVVLNAGRVVINAKEDSILVSAKDSIGMNAKTLNFDATDYVCIDGKTILLGEKARTSPATAKQPVIKGLVMQNWAHELLDALQSVSDAMVQASAVSGGPVTSLIEEGAAFRASITVLRSNLNSILSNKVYVE